MTKFYMVPEPMSNKTADEAHGYVSRKVPEVTGQFLRRALRA
jgi:hypothetical protein